MDFIQVMVVSTFDILFIVVALTVDGIGYAAWLICAAVCDRFVVTDCLGECHCH